jgi:hypothetical protein
MTIALNANGKVTRLPSYMKKVWTRSLLQAGTTDKIQMLDKYFEECHRATHNLAKMRGLDIF